VRGLTAKNLSNRGSGRGDLGHGELDRHTGRKYKRNVKNTRREEERASISPSPDRASANGVDLTCVQKEVSLGDKRVEMEREQNIVRPEEEKKRVSMAWKNLCSVGGGGDTTLNAQKLNKGDSGW